MISKIFNYYLIARESLFYIPAMICMLYALACFGAYQLDYTYSDYLNEIPMLFNSGIEDAQSIVRILLSSMITLAVLVISITMVVLSLSASQLGPRLIRIFMSDRQTKLYIGILFGSIAACFVLIGLLHEAPKDAVIPRLTVSMVFTFCFANLFVLLSYVQHVAKLSVADEIITKVHEELMSSIDRLNKENGRTPKKDDMPKNFDTNSQTVFGSRSGYIQTVDYSSLKRLSEHNDLTIKIFFKAGDYLIQGTELAKIHPKNRATPEIEQEIINSVVYGHTRTGSQDIEYSIRHLVEIGLRALSPGINDNYTAITVSNKLSAALAHLFEKTMPQRVYYDENDKIRVIAENTTESEVVLEAFSRIRNAAQAKPDVLLHLMKLIGILKKVVTEEKEKRALDQQLEFIKDHIDANFGKSSEGQILFKAHQASLGEK